MDRGGQTPRARDTQLFALSTVAHVCAVIFYAALGFWLITRLQSNGLGSLVWYTATVAILAIRAPFKARRMSNMIVEKRMVSVDRVLLFAVLMSCFFLPLLQLLFNLFSFASYALPGALTALGAVLVVVAVLIFWRSHADLGRNWSPTLEVREEHTLVTEGVYSRIRHPMYTAIFLLYIAQPLLIHNWIAGALAPVAFAVMYVMRMPEEEAMMRDLFGAEYEQYCGRTGRLVPRIAGYGSL